MRPHALLIANQASRLGGEGLEPALAVFRTLGLQTTLASAASPHEARQLIQAHASQVDRVVVGGGDGTLQGCVPALLETGLPLGILPLGTANDLARTLGLPLELAPAAEIVVRGALRRIDLGCANGVPFFNVAHIGLGARLKARMTSEVKRTWGRLSYPRALLQLLRDRRPFSAVLEHSQGQEAVRSIEIAVGNGRYYGGGMTVREDAAIDDSRLDVYSIAPVGFCKLLPVLCQLPRGPSPDNEAVRILRAVELTIRTRRPMRVVADGEWITETPVHFRVLSQALPVYCAGNDKEAP